MAFTSPSISDGFGSVLADWGLDSNFGAQFNLGETAETPRAAQFPIFQDHYKVDSVDEFGCFAYDHLHSFYDDEGGEEQEGQEGQEGQEEQEEQEEEKEEEEDNDEEAAAPIVPAPILPAPILSPPQAPFPSCVSSPSGRSSSLASAPLPAAAALLQPTFSQILRNLPNSRKRIRDIGTTSRKRERVIGGPYSKRAKDIVAMLRGQRERGLLVDLQIKGDTQPTRIEFENLGSFRQVINELNQTVVCKKKNQPATGGMCHNLREFFRRCQIFPTGRRGTVHDWARSLVWEC